MAQARYGTMLPLARTGLATPAVASRGLSEGLGATLEAAACFAAEERLGLGLPLLLLLALAHDESGKDKQKQSAPRKSKGRWSVVDWAARI